MAKMIENQACPKCEGQGCSYHLDDPAKPDVWLPRSCPRCEGTGRVPTVDVNHCVKTREDMLALSYFTLCRISDATRLADPINGMSRMVESGTLEGIVTTDWLGNFKSIR
jgi:RecJ-like exonuclease